MKTNQTTIEAVISLIKIHKVDITKQYGAWFKIANAIWVGFREEGRPYFHNISSISANYDEGECDRMYDKCESYSAGVRLETFFYYCKLHGIVLKNGEMVYEPSVIADE